MESIATDYQEIRLGIQLCETLSDTYNIGKLVREFAMKHIAVPTCWTFASKLYTDLITARQGITSLTK